MGTFTIDVGISPYTNGSSRRRRWTHLTAMVDTGATYSVVPGDCLRRIGVNASRKVSVELANGRTARWPQGLVTMRIEGREIDCPVLFGPSGGPALLGAISLEAAAFGVDPVKRRLIRLKAVALYSMGGLWAMQRGQ